MQTGSTRSPGPGVSLRKQEPGDAPAPSQHALYLHALHGPHDGATNHPRLGFPGSLLGRCE